MLRARRGLRFGETVPGHDQLKGGDVAFQGPLVVIGAADLLQREHGDPMGLQALKALVPEEGGRDVAAAHAATSIRGMGFPVSAKTSASTSTQTVLPPSGWWKHAGCLPRNLKS